MRTRKYVRRTLEEDNALLDSYYQKGIAEGKAAASKELRNGIYFQQIEAATKLINSIGQTQAQFASMLHEDGVLSKLLR